MLKYIGDFDKLKDYGFVREPNGCWVRDTNVFIDSEDGNYCDTMTIMESDKIIEFNELYPYGENHDEEVSKEIGDLIKAGLVIKESD